MAKKLKESSHTFTMPNGDEVILGDPDGMEFKNRMRLNRWGGECAIELNSLDVEGEVEAEIEGDKIKTKYKVQYGDEEFEQESEFYVQPPDDNAGYGSMIFNIIFPQQQPTNIHSLTFNSDNTTLFMISRWLSTQGIILPH